MKDTEQFIEQERRAEQAALPFVYGVSFTDCLRTNGVATELEVNGKVIQAHRIYGAWNAFLIAIKEVTEERITTTTKKGKVKDLPKVLRPTVLTNAASFMEKMFEWITTRYSEAYQLMTQKEEKEWLRTVIRFVDNPRIMENKHHEWITSGQGFVDETVAQKMAEIYHFRDVLSSVARLIHATLLVHKGREAEEWEKRRALEIITGVFDKLRVDRLGALPPIEKVERLSEGKETV
jgi:hypothetical protein